MLVRAARRKARPNVSKSRLSDQLYLPWLCPAYNTSQLDRRRNINVEAGSPGLGLAKRRNSGDASSLPSRRALATAHGFRPLDDIPFEGMGRMPPLPPSSPGGYSHMLSNLRPFDSTPIALGGSTATAPERFRLRKSGVSGDLEDVQSVFQACLQVGRIERAALLLQRMGEAAAKGFINAPTLLALHNAYLRCAVEQVMLKSNNSAKQDLHKWFELEIVQCGIVPDAETIAYLVKISLQAESGQRERLVRRYMDMIPAETGYELLYLNVLTAEEANTLVHICPQYNLAEDPEFTSEYSAEEEEPNLAETKRAIPESSSRVRAMEQKGLGLASLKQTLSIFSNRGLKSLDLAAATLEEKREFQTRLEEDAVASAIDRWREESVNLTKMGMNTALQTKSLGSRMWKWHLAMQEHLKEELVKVELAEASDKKRLEDSERCMYGPFLRILPTEKLAALTILSAMTLLGSLGVDKGIPLSNAIMAIAKNVEDESSFETIQRMNKQTIWPDSENGDVKRRLSKQDLLKRVNRYRRPGSVAKMIEDLVPDKSETHRPWPMAIRAKVGAFLMSSLIETAKVPVVLQHPETKNSVTQMQPAFMHSHQYRLGKKLGVIMANKVLVEQLQREPVHSLLAKHLPMLVTPDPWTCFNKGGFLSHPSKVMRIKLGDKDQRHYAEAAIGQGDMTQTFKGLDVLGKQSWQINQPLYDVMLEAWNSGEAIATFPAEKPNIKIPEEPDNSQGPLERRKWIKEVKNIQNTKSGMHSQRCFQNFQLEIARALKHETFYFPHNVDFRGRAYPIPPYLNHMGADHCRGLLVFGEGKELGEGGLRWLKIHLANVYGFDKASLSEREAFAATHIEKIYDSAIHPLSGGRWWLKAEDPWQCLAACMELRNALESPDPTRFVSKIPVHQDGTCNGLQHYAALGGDTWGARQVNLEPGDRPADVYTAVAELVKESIAKDKQKGNPYALILDGKITRKTVKQTVMTNVYGVTYVGAKAQVRRQLVAAHPNLPNSDTMNPGLMSSYIATKIFTALSTMFRGAHDIQYWLGECASRISSSLTPEQLDRLEGDMPRFMQRNSSDSKDPNKLTSLEEMAQFKSSVIWTTPLHMPVVQPYRKTKSKTISTHMQKLCLAEPHRSHPVNKRKQLQGFPPNFIHSLDATHMLLSAIQCGETGLSFAAVHDSFWTHACDVPKMNKILRDTFIRIHTEDVVNRLQTEFSARYKGSVYLAKISTKTPLYEKIHEWRLAQDDWKNRHANKKSLKGIHRLNELMLERKRTKLLNSEYPEEVVQGKAMVTPASIFEEMASNEDLAPADGLKDSGLGDISTREARLKTDQELEVGGMSNVEEVQNPLPGGTQMDASMGYEADDMDDESEAEAGLEAEEDANPTKEKTGFEKKLTKRDQTGQKVYSPIWLPLSFPPVPKKGGFDVTRLKDSEYFFS